MFKIISQRNSSKIAYNVMLCSAKNLRNSSNSPIDHLPTIEEKSKVAEPLRKPVKRYSPVKRSVTYPEPVFPKLPSEFKEQESLKLQKNLFFVPDHNTIFHIYLREKDKFESIHFQNTLGRLAKLCNERSKLADEIRESEIFQSICYDVWKSISRMSATEVLFACKNLLELKVPNDSLVVQSLLQMARHQINEYTYFDILILHKFLKDVENCNLKEGLQVALPKVLENLINFHFPTHLKFDAMNQLLEICVTEKIRYTKDVIYFIYKKSLPKLMQGEDDDFIRKQLCSLLVNLCELDKIPHIKVPDQDKFLDTEEPDQDVSIVGDLIYYCLDMLMEKDVYEIDKITHLTILRKMGTFFEKTGDYCVMHDRFLSEVAQVCITENWDISSVFKVIEFQLQLNYVSDQLVSFATLNLNEDLLEDLKDVSISHILLAIVSSDLPEELSRNAANFLLKFFTLEFKDTNLPWIRLAMSLLHLQYFDLNILKGIIDKNFLKRYLKSRSYKTDDYKDIVRLSKYMKSFKETCDLCIHSKLLANKEELPPAQLTNLLTKIIGSEDFILSNVVTPQGNYIDHIVALKDGNLINLKNLESSEIFNDTTGIKKIAIMEVPESLTVQPHYKLNISSKVDFHLIEQEGFVTLPIFEREITDLKEVAPSHIRTKLEKFGIYKIQ